MIMRPSKWRRGVKSRFIVPNQRESLFCSYEFCSEVLKLSDGSLSIFGFQSFDRILNNRNSPSALKQTLRRESNTVLRNDPKHDKLGFTIQVLEQLLCVPALKDVEGLLFQEDLLVLRKILRQRCRFVRHPEHALGQRFWNQLGSGCPFDAMRRKGLELGIVLRVIATMRDEKDAALAGDIGKLSDVGQQTFRTGHVQLSVGQYEISLRVDFPENQIPR